MKNNASRSTFQTKPWLILLLVLASAMLKAQKSLYFSNSPEGKHEFTLDTTRILVAFNAATNAQGRQALIGRVSDKLTYDVNLEFPQLDATVLMVQNGTNKSEVYKILQDLNREVGLQYAAPFLRYHDGVLLGVLHEINVGLKKPGDIGWLNSVCREKGLETPKPNEFDHNVYTVKVSENTMGRALDIANALYETGKPAFSEVNFLRIMKPFNTNDPLRSAQWSQTNTGKYWNGFSWVYVGNTDADMDVTEAWSITAGSSSIKVAVLDDGVQKNHPDLAANIVSGYDAMGLGSGGNPSGNDSHGTACAGIIAAHGNNNLGIAGNAYQCKIIPVRIAYTPAGQSQWYNTETILANGINWAWQIGGAAVLSNSWGGGPSSTVINNAILNAVTNGRGGKGSPVLFASGNEDASVVSFPARYSAAIAVGASNMCDSRKRKFACDGENNWGSNYGTGIDVVAPGVKIATTDLTGAAGSTSGDYTYSFNGTSSACPNAASVMALILSVNPNLTQAQARAILEGTCDKVGGYGYSSNSNQPNGTWNSEMGHGRVNAQKAVQSAVPATCTAPTTSQLSVTNLTSNSARLNCSVSGVQTYDWAYRQVGASSWTDLSSTTVNYTNISGLTSNKQYEFKAAVRCSNNTWSSWSAVKTFSTTGSGSSTPPNDAVCSATLITAGSSCSYTSSSTNGATATFNDVMCGTTNPKDVWFRCAIPSSGKVTFRTSAGSLSDAVMGIFWGSSCNNLNYISCEDDNSNGNGSNMPVMTITGQAGTMLWVRIWGYGSAAGSFSICAMNYSTANFGGNDEGIVYNIDPTQSNPYPVDSEPIDETMQSAERDLVSPTSQASVGSIFPNPATGQALLPYTLTDAGTVQIVLCDLLGRTVQTQAFEQTAGEQQAELDLNALNPGVYYVRFRCGDFTEVQQLQIVR